MILMILILINWRFGLKWHLVFGCDLQKKKINPHLLVWKCRMFINETFMPKVLWPKLGHLFVVGLPAKVFNWCARNVKMDPKQIGKEIRSLLFSIRSPNHSEEQEKNGFWKKTLATLIVFMAWKKEPVLRNNMFGIICYFRGHRWKSLISYRTESINGKMKYFCKLMCHTCWVCKEFDMDQYICGICAREECDGKGKCLDKFDNKF